MKTPKKLDPSAPKPPGIFRSWNDQLLGTTREPDQKTPSAARIFGGCLIVLVLLLQILSTAVVTL